MSGLTVEDAAKGLLHQEPEKGQPEPEVDADLTEPEDEDVEEIEDDPETDTDDEDSDDDSEDGEPEDEPDEDNPEEDDDDPEIEITTKRGTESVKLSELQAGYLRNKDYTQKTMSLAQDKTAFETEREQVQGVIKQQYAQLQDALATFAIEQAPEPDWAAMDPKDYPKQRSQWDKKQQQKQQATDMYRQLQAQQRQDTLQRETAAMLEVFPEWRDPEAFSSARLQMHKAGADYGFSAEEMDQIADHRMFRVLDELARLKKTVNTQKTNAAKVTKRVAKATRKPAPGSKPAKNQSQEQSRRKKLDRLERTHSLRDAAAAIIME